jgi:Zn-dependent membrane protease YugP
MTQYYIFLRSLPLIVSGVVLLSVAYLFIALETLPVEAF